MRIDAFTTLFFKTRALGTYTDCSMKVIIFINVLVMVSVACDMGGVYGDFGEMSEHVVETENECNLFRSWFVFFFSYFFSTFFFLICVKR